MSDAIQTSVFPGCVSKMNSAARWSSEGMFAAASVARVLVMSAKLSGEGMSCGVLLAESISTRRVASKDFIASRTRSIASARLDAVVLSAVISMEGERSRMRMTVSSWLAPHPSNPPIMGRATAKARQAMPRVRAVRMRMCLSFFLPRDSRVALSKNCMAAHCRVLWRRRFNR